MKQYTLKEAEKVTGISERTLRRYVKSGKIKSEMREGQYHINESDLASYIKPVNVVDSTPFPTVPTTSTDLQELLARINEGFKGISDSNTQIAERYQQTVTPIVNHYITTDEQAFFQRMSEFTQTLLNNSLSLIRISNPDSLTISEIADIMTKGLNMPTEVKEKLVTYALQTAMQHHADTPALPNVI